MTVATTDNVVSYSSDGVTVLFTFLFKTFHETDIKVYFNSIVQASGYSVLLNPDQDANPGGSVTLDAAQPADDIITLAREVDYVQLVDYQPYDPFPAEVNEQALDTLTMQTQQLQEQLDRTFKEPIGGGEDVDYTFPPFIAGRSWKWNDGTPNPALIVTDYDPDQTRSVADAHIADTSNPHSVTFAQVGADPAGTGQAAADVVQGNLDDHEADFTNPHQVDAAQAGADPAGSADAVQGRTSSTHVADVTNPHNVTADQTGAPFSNPTGVTGADAVANIISLTQAEYDAITPNASTLYLIAG